MANPPDFNNVNFGMCGMWPQMSFPIPNEYLMLLDTFSKVNFFKFY